MLKESALFEKREIRDKEIAELLRVRGIEGNGIKLLLEKWTKQEERKVADTPEASIQFNLRRARVYLAAGYYVAALENFEAARMQAWNENRTELYNHIMIEMNEIDNK